MRTNMNRYLLLLAFFLLAAAANGQGAEVQRGSPGAEQRSLRSRIQALTKERQFLLFQKEMLASDSKYLLIDVTAKTGKLKFKNRVLKDFGFLPSGSVPGHKVRAGMIALTAKTEGKNGRHVLIFGDALILQWKRPSVPADEKDIPVITLNKRDLQSVFYAVEPGALAYIIR